MLLHKGPQQASYATALVVFLSLTMPFEISKGRRRLLVVHRKYTYLSPFHTGVEVEVDKKSPFRLRRLQCGLALSKS